MAIGRRSFLFATVGAAAFAHTGLRAAHAGAQPQVSVYKGPHSECCDGWVEQHEGEWIRRERGGSRGRLAVPSALRSTRSAELLPYKPKSEGMQSKVMCLPADVRRLLRERPKGQGLAVPVMVPGFPGMGGAAVAITKRSCSVGAAPFSKSSSATIAHSGRNQKKELSVNSVR